MVYLVKVIDSENVIRFKQLFECEHSELRQIAEDSKALLESHLRREGDPAWRCDVVVVRPETPMKCEWAIITLPRGEA